MKINAIIFSILMILSACAVSAQTTPNGSVYDPQPVITADLGFDISEQYPTGEYKTRGSNQVYTFEEGVFVVDDIDNVIKHVSVNTATDKVRLYEFDNTYVGDLIVGSYGFIRDIEDGEYTGRSELMGTARFSECDFMGLEKAYPIVCYSEKSSHYACRHILKMDGDNSDILGVIYKNYLEANHSLQATVRVNHTNYADISYEPLRFGDAEFNNSGTTRIGAWNNKSFEFMVSYGTFDKEVNGLEAGKHYIIFCRQLEDKWECSITPHFFESPRIWIDSVEYTKEDTAVALTGTELSFDPAAAGLSFDHGDTVTVKVYAEDRQLNPLQLEWNFTIDLDADDDNYTSDVDCDDNDAAVHPGAAEICDGIDNDCNPGTADGSGETWFNQATSCGTGVCQLQGALVCVNATKQDTCQPGTPGTETCNGKDDDCDGKTDEGLSCGGSGSGGGSGGGSSGSSGGSAVCEPDWECTYWTACSYDGIRTRICRD
ncbi:hypothetical protein GF351_03060, partial [Candidatus Woesearchaeota archaeon]|nr:hypothetical protein [Candidatus Woesearchaeota archaeon]